MDRGVRSNNMFLGASFEPPPIQTRKALLVIDFQKDFTSENAKLSVSNAGVIVSRVASLATAFRETGDIVWANTEFRGPCETVSKETGSYSILIPQFLPEDSDSDDAEDEEKSTGGQQRLSLDHHNETAARIDQEAFLADVPEDSNTRCCIPGSEGCKMQEPLASLVDASRDLCIIKSNYSAFSTPTLLLSLRAKLVTELYVCGSLSHISVYATVVDAIRNGFTVNVLEDCVGYGNAKCHKEALRQMQDIFGADILTSRELLQNLGLGTKAMAEDMAEESFKTQLPSATTSSESLTLRPKVEKWMSGVSNNESVETSTKDESSDQGSEVEKPAQPRSRSSPAETKPGESKPTNMKLADKKATGTKSAVTKTKDATSPGPSKSPPRKRSTQDMDSKDATLISGDHVDQTGHPAVAQGLVPQVDAHPRRRRRTDEDSSSTHDSQRSTDHRSPSVSRISPPAAEILAESNSKAPSIISVDSHVGSIAGKANSREEHQSERKIGEGDSYLIPDLLSETELDDVFERLKAEVQFQKMHHRSGEVPRLVAVQGDVLEDDSVPIYRHPADESPNLRPFSPTVEMIRSRVKKTLGQPFNHALIQLYRNGEDSISEHSDKTLDIVRGTNIVNFSVGARRTMVLRTKKGYKSALVQGDHKAAKSQRTSDASPAMSSRRTERLRLPHNSLFVLGSATNTSWLHSIRADKRRSAEKAVDELAFGGQRISITFRLISTFLNPKAGLIWGQGATSKISGAPSKVIQDDREVQRLIMAFGEENHKGIEFDWEKTYGAGFDVVNFVTS